MVSSQKVNFASEGINVVGDLYLPAKSTTDRKHAVVVAQFNDRSESTDEPRGLEDPFQRAEDVRSAVTYLSTLKDLDLERIGALGTCASGGYVPFAAQTDVPTKAVETVIAVCAGETTRMDSSKALLTVLCCFNGSKHPERRELQKSGEKNLPLQPLFLQDQVMSPSLPHSCSRNWRITINRPGAIIPDPPIHTQRSTDLGVDYSSFAFNDMISPHPLLMIAGSDAASPILVKTRSSLRRSQKNCIS